MKLNQTLRRGLGVLLALVMCLSLLPATALAEGTPTETADFTNDAVAALALLNAAKTEGAADSEWDSTNQTLTLNGVNFTTSAATAVKLPDNAKIVLTAGTTNTITSTSEGGSSCGIYATNGLTIEGGGTLTVTGGKVTDNYSSSYGVRIYAGDVTIQGGTVMATGGEVTGTYGSSRGIFAAGSIEISGGSVEATGGEVTGTYGSSKGIFAKGSIEISGGSVEATGGTADGSSGLDTDTGVTISGDKTEVTAKGDTASLSSKGIYAGGSIGISGGRATATGGAATGSGGQSSGIYAIGSIEISGGTVEATSGTAAHSYGFYISGSVTISGDTTDITARSVTDGTDVTALDSCGIYAVAGMAVSGGAVEATGGETENSSNGIKAGPYLTISGGTVTATGGQGAPSSCGIITDNYSAVTISGGHVIAQTLAEGSETRMALTKAPDLSGYTGYWWRTGPKNFYTDEAYVYSADHTYVEFFDAATAPTCTVTFDANGGSGSMAPVTASGSYTLPACEFTAPEGKWFKGWAASATGEVITGAAIIVTEDTTLYAVWEDAEHSIYTVTVENDGNGSATATPAAAVAGTEITLSATANSGYHFKEWQVISGGVTITDNKFTMPASDVTVKAIFEADVPSTTCTVRFAANGGSGAMAAVTVTSGEKYILPACGFTAPEGMQFKGWATDAYGEVITDAAIPVTGDVTLYAIWEVAEHSMPGYHVILTESFEDEAWPTGWSVEDKDGDGYNWRIEYEGSSYHCHHGSRRAISASYANGGVALTPDNWLYMPEITIGTGYKLTFCLIAQDEDWPGDKLGVYISTDGGESYTQIGEDYEAGTTWTEHTVDLSAYAGEEAIIAFVHHNCTDKFWLDLDCVFIWAPDDTTTTYTVTVENDGNGSATATPAAAVAGTEITLTATANSGYHFKEWQVISGSVTITDNKFTMPASDVTVKAIFEADAPETYTVTVENDGNGSATATPATAAAGTEITLSATANSGYHFKEWQVISGGVTITDNKFTMPASDVTVKAIFEADAPTTYTVTVENDGNGSATATPATAAAGTEITLSATANSGYHFKEWQVISGSVIITDNKFTMPASDVTVKAIFEADAPTTYTVRFDANGGSGSMDAVTVASGENYTLPECGFTAPEGKRFKGWATSATGEVITDAAIPVTGDVTLYAIWEDVSAVTTYTVTVNGSYAVTTGAGEYEAGDIVTLAAGSRSGYTFSGWTSDDITVPNADKANTGFVMPAKNVTVTANWTKDWQIVEPVKPVKPAEPVKPSTPFTDVPWGAYYEDAVIWAVNEGITSGTTGTTFSPDEACTRAQAVTFLWRAAGSPAPKSATMPFTDVAEGSYYYDAVLWALEQGITKGTSDTTFSPDDTCTRAQIVTFLWRAQNSPAAGSVNPFRDVASDDYYADAVLWAVENDITTGTSATTFSPDSDCTRAQIVTFLYRCLGK